MHSCAHPGQIPDRIDHLTGRGDHRSGSGLGKGEVRSAQLRRVVVEVRREEDHRLAGDAVVEHHRGVVGDHHVGDRHRGR